MRCTVFDHARNSLLAGCGNGTIAVIDLTGFKVEQIIDAHKKDFSVNALCLSPDGNFLLSGSRDAHLNVFDIKNNYHLVTSLPAHNYAIYKIAFSPDGKYFATASRDKTCKIWDANSMEVITRLDHERSDGHVNSVNTLLWMNNNLLVTAGDDRAIICWQLS